MKVVIGLVVALPALTLGASSCNDEPANKRPQCEAFYKFAQALDQGKWDKCLMANGPRDPCSSCPSKENLVTCDSSGFLTAIDLSSSKVSGVSLTSESDFAGGLTDLAALSPGVTMLKIADQSSLGLTSCYSECESDFTCDFSGSTCTSDCTEDGVCATEPPTDTPTTSPVASPVEGATEAPVASPTETSAPSVSPTMSPTDNSTDAPTEAPTPCVMVIPDPNATNTSNATIEVPCTGAPSAAPVAGPKGPDGNAPSSASTIVFTGLATIMMLVAFIH